MPQMLKEAPATEVAESTLNDNIDFATAALDSSPKTAPTPEVIMPFHYEADEIHPVERLGEIKRKPIYSFVKRCFDIFASLFGLILMAFPMLVIAIAIGVICFAISIPIFNKKQL